MGFNSGFKGLSSMFVERMRESNLPGNVQDSVAISMHSIRKKLFESFLMKLRSRDEREFILELTCAL